MSPDWRDRGLGKTDRRRTGYDQEVPSGPEIPAPDFSMGRRVPDTLGQVRITVTFRMKGATEQRRINYVLGG